MVLWRVMCLDLYMEGRLESKARIIQFSTERMEESMGILTPILR